MAIDKKLIDNLIGNLGVEKSDVQISTDVIDVLLQKYIKKWHSNLNKRNQRASDNLYQSLGSKSGEYGFKVEQGNGSLNLILYLADYYYWTDKGRKPTSKGGNGKVRKALMGRTGWIAYKGLVGSNGMTVKQKRKLKSGQVKTYTRKLSAIEANKMIAFLISRKIHKKGFKGSNWFSSELKNFEKEITTEMAKLTGQIVNLTIERFTK